MRISDPAWNESEPPCYLEPQLEHPLFMEAIDQALALCSEDGGPPHVKLVMEWAESSKKSIIADDGDLIEEHSTVKLLRAQALQGNNKINDDMRLAPAQSGIRFYYLGFAGFERRLSVLCLARR